MCLFLSFNLILILYYVSYGVPDIQSYYFFFLNTHPLILFYCKKILVNQILWFMDHENLCQPAIKDVSTVN